MDARELLAAVRVAQGLPSNYALARAFDISERSLQRWNTGTHYPDDEMAARLAELAGLDPDAVVASMHAARCSDPAGRARWQRIAARLQQAGAAVLCAVLSLWISGGPDAGAALAFGVLAPLWITPGQSIDCGRQTFRALALAWRSLLMSSSAAPIAA